MEPGRWTVNPALLEGGLRFAGLALIFVTVWSFISGSAPSTGAAVRESLKPGLRSIRDSSTWSRSELADRTIVAAVAVAAVSTLVDQSLLSAIVAGLLWQSRPALRRATSEEQPLLAFASQLSSDMMIGLYTPMVLAQLLLGNHLLALAFSFVAIALSWPPGGAGRAHGVWRPAWVTS